MNFQEISPTNENSLLLTEAMQIKINASMKKTYPTAEDILGDLKWKTKRRKNKMFFGTANILSTVVLVAIVYYSSNKLNSNSKIENKIK